MRSITNHHLCHFALSAYAMLMLQRTNQKKKKTSLYTYLVNAIFLLCLFSFLSFFVYFTVFFFHFFSVLFILLSVAFVSFSPLQFFIFLLLNILLLCCSLSSFCYHFRFFFYFFGWVCMWLDRGMKWKKNCRERKKEEERQKLNIVPFTRNFTIPRFGYFQFINDCVVNWLLKLKT